MKKKLSKNAKMVLEILKNEIDGDVESALKKIRSEATIFLEFVERNEV
jgi:hypothetical protein